MTQLTDAKLDTMVSAVQQFVARTVVDDLVIALTTEQLLKLIAVSSADLKADPSAILKLQEMLMLSGVCLVSLPTEQRESATEGKAKKLYYIFRDTNTFLTDAEKYSMEDFEDLLNSKQVLFADIQNLKRLNLPEDKVASVVCEAVGHSRLSIRQTGKCSRCGAKIPASAFTVLITDKGNVGIVPAKFRPIDRLDWKDLIFVNDKTLLILAKSKKFKTVVDVNNSYDLITPKSESDLSDDDKLALHKIVASKLEGKDKDKKSRDKKARDKDKDKK